MEYSTDKSTWTTWDGSQVTAVSNGSTYALYFRGTDNTKVSHGRSNRWILTGTNIACTGNIESILDHATVAAGNHPTMAGYCYSYMFRECTSLTTAPDLPATTLTTYCYLYMFYGCTGLVSAPAILATTLADNCCYLMFYNCTSLTTAPALPATTLVSGCYEGMFKSCTKLKLSATQTGNYTKAYRIPASGTGTTATNALTDMFANTGGTFKGTPEINTTYYLDESNTIV